MSVARSEVALAALDGCVYAIGGWDGTSRLACVECYDPASNRWDIVQPMKVPLTCPAVASLHGKLFVTGVAVADIGGSCADSVKSYNPIADDIDSINSVQCYDPKADSWKELTPMLMPRSGAASCVFDRKIYVIGGWHVSEENTNKVECFDPRTNVWRFCRPMKERRYKPGVAVVGNRNFCVWRRRELGPASCDNGGLRCASGHMAWRVGNAPEKELARVCNVKHPSANV
ncbi:hypothetical protein HPB51_002199 [Rhipicephalus microplus]|uniref:Uncharacterized protein n=1 Tax=Rhipicephalus microplus TaxID=6941 RepID=A0A9J6EJX9_RHIMP|nr:hypothetical protein HPB51_002199 [Rhipicephalus microplus]